MASARSIVLAAASLLLIGSAVKAQPGGPPAEHPADATALSTAAAVTSHPWSIAERPRYMPPGWHCSPGLVWRNAGSTDWLCVDPAEAQRIEEENQQAAENLADGSCRPGLVRREAFKKDVVCVDPVRRDAIREMNAVLYTVR